MSPRAHGRNVPILKKRLRTILSPPARTGATKQLRVFVSPTLMTLPAPRCTSAAANERLPRASARSASDGSSEYRPPRSSERRASWPPSPSTPHKALPIAPRHGTFFVTQDLLCLLLIDMRPAAG